MWLGEHSACLACLLKPWVLSPAGHTPGVVALSVIPIFEGTGKKSHFRLYDEFEASLNCTIASKAHTLTDPTHTL